MLNDTIVWASVGGFDVKDDLFTDKGLIMDLSVKNRISSAGAGDEQFFRAQPYEAACSYTHHDACQHSYQKTTISFCQNAFRQEDVHSLLYQRKREKEHGVT